jgi:hypothetical protein
MTDLMIIIVLTLASCLAVGLIGLGLLHLVRYRSLRQQLTIATLLPVVAVATTVLINVQLMFLSAHDSLVILIALLVSLLLAAVGAWLVVRRISRASRRLGAGLHQLVSDSSSGSRILLKRAALLPNLEPGNGPLNGPVRSWSASCPMTCVRRWPVCGPSRRDWRTG